LVWYVAGVDATPHSAMGRKMLFGGNTAGSWYKSISQSSVPYTISPCEETSIELRR
jgi:hypothetical protein